MKFMLNLKVLRFILLLIQEMDITIWFYLKSLDQKQHLFPHLESGNLKDVHLV